MMRMVRFLAVLTGAISLLGCTLQTSPHVTPQNNPGLHLENRRVDTSFQVSTLNFAYSRSYYYRNPGPQQPYSQTTKIISAVFYTKIFEHQQKLGWCGGFAVADDDAGDLQMVAGRAGYFTSYMQVDSPEAEPRPRIWTGPFIANKSNRPENIMTGCAVTTHPWLPSYETTKLSVHLHTDFQTRMQNQLPQGGS